MIFKATILTTNKLTEHETSFVIRQHCKRLLPVNALFILNINQTILYKTPTISCFNHTSTITKAFQRALQ